MHSEHIVQIEKLVVGGDGLARLQYQDKQLVVFIPQSAPNETVKIRITQAEKNHLIGEIIEITKASGSRRHPQCEYFLNCGGCTWQHISEDEQLRQKEQILLGLLKKFIPEQKYSLLPTVQSEHNFNYRNRIQLKQLGPKLGYFKKKSHEIVDITHCPIAEKPISDEIAKLKAKLRPSTEIKKYELRINQNNAFEHYPIGEEGEGLAFSQVNTAVNHQLVAAVTRIATAAKPGVMTELYAGAGNFSFPMLAAIPDLKIESAELNSKLTSYASQQLLGQKLQKRLFAFTTDCESFVKRRSISKEFVLLDPPRAGLSETVLGEVLKADSQNLLYVSCHPVFLARDLAQIFKSNPGYQIRHLQIFDMFPQTDHFETLVWLAKSV